MGGSSSLDSSFRYDSVLLALAMFVLLVWIYLLFFHAGFWRMIHFLPADCATEKRLVAVVIPARNEAESIGRAVSSLLRQDFSGEIRLFVVDDSSADGTANAARAAAGVMGAGERLTVIRAPALPQDWTGKTWAMQKGWQSAREIHPDYLLLTDADIEHAPDNLGRLVAQAEHGPYDLVSLLVKLRCASLAEKLLVPAFVYFFFLLYPPKRISNTRSGIAGAAGGCMLLRPEVLERAGGFEGIRSEIIDDCSLAALLKHAGGRLWLGVTRETRSIRGYETFENLRNMIARTAFNQLRHSTLLLAACIAGVMLTFVAPIVLVWSRTPVAGWMALTASLMMFTTYIPVLRLYRVNPLAAVSLPFAALFYLYATLYSAVNYWRGRGGEWKGRSQDVTIRA